MESKSAKDFFISYTQVDSRWAEWVAWQLEEAGYDVIIQAWDFAAGANFLERMDTASKEAGRTLLILTPAALGSRFVGKEWTAALNQEHLVPVRVQECDPGDMLGTRSYIDLVGLEEEEARTRLLARLEEGRAKPDTAPGFPSAISKSERSVPQPLAFPGALPPFWHVPYRRNPAFTGRETLLAKLHTALTSDKIAALTQTIAGLGGTGKTQLALEYSYLHSHEYTGLWWLRAETPETLVADYAALADAAGLPERESTDQVAIVEAVRWWLARQENLWLLIFDNAMGPESLRDYLPKRTFHHVLVTSYNPVFGGVAKPLEVKVFEREESTAFLLKRTGSGGHEAADVLADELDDLPLALEQAGAYIETAGLSLSAYLERYRTHHAKLLARGNLSTDYPDTVATTWSLAFEAVEVASPAGAALLNVLAFLAPDAIPRALIVEGAEYLPEALADAVRDGLALDEAVAALRRHSLIETTGELWSVHRLVQAVTRDRLGDDAAPWARAAVTLINGAFPYEKNDLTTWTPSEALLPHALVAAEQAEALGVGREDAAQVLNDAGLYLMGRAQLTEAHSVFERALEIYEQVYGPEHPNVATVVNNIGQILNAQNDLEGALTYTKRALAIGEQVYGPEHPSVAIFANNIGTTLKAKGNLEGALTYTKRALAIDEQVYGPRHPNVARDVNNIGQILKDQGDLEGALTYAKRALAIGEQVYGPEHPTVAIRANNIGQILKDQGDLEGALTYTKRALAIDEQVYGPQHPNVAMDAKNIGLILKYQGDLEGALSYTKRALAIDEQAYGPEHPAVAIDANNIGQILKAQGDLEAALIYAKRALTIGEQVYGLEHPTVAIRANNIGTILKAQGDLEGALTYAKRALAIDEQIYGPEHPSVGRDANNIGQMLQAQGDLEGALTYAKRALAIDEQAYGPVHPEVAIDVNNIGLILKAQGDLEGALTYVKRALTIDEQVYGHDHPTVATLVNNIGLILQAQGDLEGALTYAKRALAIVEAVYGHENPSTRTVARNLALIEESLQQ